jgi:excisionase family DNA binding protein
MDRNVEKLLYSRRDAAEALSLSIRSIDYLIASSRLPARRIGSKILIPASAIQRFAIKDHPASVRSTSARVCRDNKPKRQLSNKLANRIGPQSEELDESRQMGNRL